MMFQNISKGMTFKMFANLADSISFCFLKWAFASYLAQPHKAYHSLYEIKLNLTIKKAFLYGGISSIKSCCCLSLEFLRNNILR